MFPASEKFAKKFVSRNFPGADGPHETGHGSEIITPFAVEERQGFADLEHPVAELLQRHGMVMSRTGSGQVIKFEPGTRQTLRPAEVFEIPEPFVEGKFNSIAPLEGDVRGLDKVRRDQSLLRQLVKAVLRAAIVEPVNEFI